MPMPSLSSRSGLTSRVTVAVLLSSTTILPLSPRISNRSVPTRSWMAVTNVPVAPSP